MPMPRLTDHPSGISCATRAANASRPSGCHFLLSDISVLLPGGARLRLQRSRLEGRVAAPDIDEPIDIEAGGRDLLRRQLAQFGDVLRLRDRQLGSRRHDRVEIAPGVAIDEVAPA